MTAQAAPLYSVMYGPSAVVVDRLLEVLFPDARTIVDLTYGRGAFWHPRMPRGLELTTMDIDPARMPDVVGDFRAASFADGALDVAVFDPPYHTNMGRGKASVMGGRFGHFATIPDLELAVRLGCREAARVSRLGAIVKVQDYIHASRPVRMTGWVKAELGEPYDELIHARRQKLRDPKWTRQLSVWRNHATFLIFRHDGAVHKPRPGKDISR